MDDKTKKKIVEALPIENGGFALIFSPENNGDGFSLYVSENILEGVDALELENPDGTEVPGMYVLFKGLTSIIADNLHILMEEGQQAIVDEVSRMDGEESATILPFTPSKRLH